MHDCLKTGECLVEAVFDELSEDPRQRMLIEIEECAHCRPEYETLRAALARFDEASSLMLPDDNYWRVYEATLLAKLRPKTKRVRCERLLIGLRILSPTYLRAAAVAALALLALLSWTWSMRRSQFPVHEQRQEAGIDANEVVLPRDSPGNNEQQRLARSPKREREYEVIPIRPADRRSAQLSPRTIVPPVSERNVNRQGEVPEQPVSESILAADGMTSIEPMAGVVNEQTLRHFEKLQIFLRSFRNLSLAGPEFPQSIADEAARSRALLLQNVVLRREAETNGILPVEQLLDDLEPVLIDIANLSEKATPEDVRVVTGRIQHKDIVASLQVYSAHAGAAGVVR